MLKTVKIEMEQYKAAKAYAKKDGRKLQYVLTEAVRSYLASRQSKQEAA